IRTAYQATPDRLRPMRDLADETKACIALWRAGLVAQCEGELPGRLSPAEERRVARQAEVRMAALQDGRERVREKLRVQQEERRQVEARGADLPPISFGRYLLYLGYLRPLPARAPPPPVPSPPEASAHTPEPAPAA